MNVLDKLCPSILSQDSPLVRGSAPLGRDLSIWSKKQVFRGEVPRSHQRHLR